MPKKIYVTPAPGLKIRNPETMKHLPVEGEWATRSLLWKRHEKDGSVTISDSAPTPKKTSLEKKGA